MRNRNNSRGGNSSRPSAGGSKDGGGYFKRTKPEVESRFSKPSIKKSSLRFSAPAENKGQKARPSFDHERSRDERSGYDKPGFTRPDFKKWDKGGNDRPFRREGDSAERGFKKDFGKKDFRSGDRPERPGFGGDRNREFKPRFDRDNDEREFRPRPERDARDFKSRPERGNGDREFKPRFERDDRDFKPRGERPGQDRPGRSFDRNEGPFKKKKIGTINPIAPVFRTMSRKTAVGWKGA
ncbi:hypothetical protein [Dyadobacter sp. 676]|uniref:Uncharacterized protein n=1 Tax=Dyadobacter sp. 676 TaxID=3088362 RepID=A0AAU8FU16_9BACT